MSNCRTVGQKRNLSLEFGRTGKTIRWEKKNLAREEVIVENGSRI